MKELALYIDIEGFGEKFENGGKQSFIDLTNDLFALGQNKFKHLSIIQFGGDGFLIKEIITYTNDLNKFIDIAVALLQAITLRGGVGRAQISSGYMADISGLYSKDIQTEMGKEGSNNILGNHKNIMLINTVIGTSIINCYKLKGPSGPLLLIDKNLIEEGEENKYIFYKKNQHEVYGVNWIHYKNETTNQYLSVLGLDSESVITRLNQYLQVNKLKDEWVNEAKKLISKTWK